MKLLLVEDDEAILEGLVFCLKKEGFLVKGLTNAYQALELIKNENFDLLVLDINLPDMNGLKLYRQIKENKDIPRLLKKQTKITVKEDSSLFI